MTWCEHCRDHFSKSHYDSEGMHQAGAAYGPFGLSLEAEAIVRDLAADIRHLWSEAVWCKFCHIERYPDYYDGSNTGREAGEQDHTDGCLWRRAVEWVRDQEAK